MPSSLFNKQTKKKSHLFTVILFIDYGKAYDDLNSDILWKIMEHTLIQAIESLYKNTQIYIKYVNTEPIATNKGL
jgi:hypothetical protein